MSAVFFYGLFMDAALLREKGLHPICVGSAELSDYQIRIGSRATLVPSVGSAAFGVVMELTAEEAESLYSEPSVSDYRPETIRVQLIDGAGTIEAICYNLPPDFTDTGTNVAYAEQLSALVLKLGFAAPYADEIAQFVTRRSFEVQGY